MQRLTDKLMGLIGSAENKRSTDSRHTRDSTSLTGTSALPSSASTRGFGGESVLSTHQSSQQPSEIDLVRSDLRRLLRLHPDAWKVVPHLAYVAKNLGKSGLGSLNKTPLPVLRRAIKQLDMLAPDVSGHEGLTILRDRINLTINTLVDASMKSDALDTLRDAREVEIEEADFALFEAESKAWQEKIDKDTKNGNL